ncbi:MAG: hypothetical protein RL291_1829 [Pseudomonadota bacterium]
MKLPSRNILIFNGVAGVIMLLGAFSMARALVTKPEVPTCTARSDVYARSYTLSLEREGEPVRLADFQSELNGTDFGVADHMRIRALTTGPARAVMIVSMGKGSSSPKSANGYLGGVSFPWRPDDLAGKKSVCLVYHMFLPVDFNFGAGGTLPGITGGLRDRPEDGSITEYIARLVWRRDGDVALVGAKVERNQRKVEAIHGKGAVPKLERGKWVQIQQEFQPNDPGAANGVFRLWVGGKLAIDRADVNFLAHPNQYLAGVSTDVHFGNELTEQTSPKDQQIFLTPMQLYYSE